MQKNDRNFLEAFGEGVEAAWDLAISSEAIQAVPVVGTAFKLLKGLDDLRSRALATKLRKFLDEPRLRDAIEARTLRHQILDEPGKDQEIGETLFLTLDNVTDFTKPVLLARAYAAYLNNEIDAFSLEAIAHVLNTAFLRDVLAFLQTSPPPNDTLWKERLAAAGLLQGVGETWDDELTYVETPLGATFEHAIGRIEIPSS